nr:apoptotic protease-activating factor 1 [Polypodium hydriforme]
MDEERLKARVLNSIALRKALQEDLQVSDVTVYLISKLLLTRDETELIMNAVTSSSKVMKLIDTLSSKPSKLNPFRHFRDSLVDSGYQHLADMMIDTNQAGDFTDSPVGEDNTLKEIQKILENADVPARPAEFVERPEAVLAIRSALLKLHDSDGWVVVHGSVGSGKTILTADALLNSTIQRAVFSGGIFWISIGVIDENKLLIKLQNLHRKLCLLRDRPVLDPKNLEEARDKLQYLFESYFPQSLLVIDDIWEGSYIKYLDLCGRTLATTRFADIRARYAGNTFSVPMDDFKLTEDQRLSLLASWTRSQVGSLPTEAKGIVSECSSPLGLSIVGALLRRYPNRWDFYLEQLKNRNWSRLRVGIPYQYSSLYEAVDIGVQNLGDRRSYYETMALFKDDTPIPLAVLATAWDMDVFDAEDTMDEIVSHSLAIKAGQSYMIHDINLDYLKQTLDSKIPGMHADFVQRYSAKCTGDYWKLSNDGYIHWNLIEHLLQAGNTTGAVQLATDLRWLDSKMRNTVLADALNDFGLIIKYNPGVEGVLQPFKQFIGRLAYLFEGKCFIDIVQLALKEPSESVVYQAACRYLAQKPPSPSTVRYFEWSNKPQSITHSRLHFRVGQVSSCTSFTAESREELLLTSVEDKICVYNLDDGRLVKELRCQKGADPIVVNWITVSPDGHLLALAASNGSVVLWNLQTWNEVCTFRGHCPNEARSCCFSPNGSLIGTVDFTGCLLVWNWETRLVRYTFGDKDLHVTCFAFHPDCEAIALGTVSGSVQVLDMTTCDPRWTFQLEEDSLMLLQFSLDGRLLFTSNSEGLHILNMESGTPLLSNLNGAKCVGFSLASHDPLIALGFMDGSAQVWNYQLGICASRFSSHSRWVSSLCFSPSSKELLVCSSDETFSVSSLNTGSTQNLVKLRKVFDVSFKGADITVAAANSDRQVVIHGGREGREVFGSQPLSSGITVCKFIGDLYVAAACRNGSATTFSFSGDCWHQGRTLQTSSAPASINDLAGSLFGENPLAFLLACCSDDHNIYVWDVLSGTLLKTLVGHLERVVKVKFLPTSKILISCSHDGSARVWSTEDFGCLRSLSTGSEALVALCVSSSCTSIFAGSVNKSCYMWDLRDCTPVQLGGHEACVRHVQLSDDQLRLAVGCDDGSVTVWDLTSRKVVWSKGGHTGWVTHMAFRCRSHELVTVSNSLRWWGDKGDLLQEFPISGRFARFVHASPDFSIFITIDDAGFLYILQERVVN